MKQAEAVRSESRDVLVVDKMLPFQFKFVIFQPIPADCQNVVGTLNHRHYVRQRDACCFPFVILGVAQSVNVQVYVYFVDREPIIIHIAKAGLFVLGLLDVRRFFVGLRQVNV